MLTVEGLHSRYGRAQILHGVSFTAAAGEVLVLLGRNGAGKSTTLKSIIGLVRPTAGRITFAGHQVQQLETYRIARLGLGYVPEERRIFTDLTVRENLDIGRQPPRPGLTPWTPDRLYDLFPNLGTLRDRPGARMSGGEQQMLTVARTLMGNPRCILLDEPSEGLAPKIVEQMADAILQIKAEGVSIVLAEQNLHFATQVADKALIIEAGQNVWSGTIPALTADSTAQTKHLAV